MENLDIYAYELAENKAREECADLIDGITNGFSPSDNENFDIALNELHIAIAKLFYLKGKVKELKSSYDNKEKAAKDLGLRREEK